MREVLAALMVLFLAYPAASQGVDCYSVTRDFIHCYSYGDLPSSPSVDDKGATGGALGGFAEGQRAAEQIRIQKEQLELENQRLELHERKLRLREQQAQQLNKQLELNQQALRESDQLLARMKYCASIYGTQNPASYKDCVSRR